MVIIGMVIFTGSPPRHLKEAAERTRKIPSLFDIEVFPPTKYALKPFLPDAFFLILASY